MSQLTVVVQVAAAVALASGVRSFGAMPTSQLRCPLGIGLGIALWVAGSLLATPTNAWLGLLSFRVILVVGMIWTVRHLGDGRTHTSAHPWPRSAEMKVGSSQRETRSWW